MFNRANNYFLTEVPATGGTLNEGLIGLPRTINPVLAITEIDRDISSLVYAGLMKYSDGELVPDIAKSYTVSDDGLTYSFVIRDDVHFQDGIPLTTDDIVFTITKIQEANLKSPRRPDWTNIVINQKSETEISFTLKQAYSPFLTNTTVGILPKHIWGSLTDNEFIFNNHNIEPVGAGPYKVTSVKKDSESIPTEYTLKTWHGYHEKVPYLSSIVFKFFADENKAISALKDGTIDSLPAVSALASSELAESSIEKYTLLSEPLPRIFGIFFNQNQNPVLADKVVRRALEMAIDRQEIIDSVLFGYGMPLTGPLPLYTSGLTDSHNSIETTTETSTTTPSRIIKAMEYLEDNGWSKNSDGIYEKETKSSTQQISFTLYTADTPDLKKTADIIEDFWKRLGVSIEIKVFESNDLYQNIIKTRKYDALLFGEQIGKDRDLYAFWHSSQRNAPGLNVSMYTNSKVDKLLEDIRKTDDAKLRSEKYVELDELIRNDIPAIFLYSPNFIYVIPKSIQNIRLETMSTPSDRWNSVEEWYQTTEKVWKWFARE